ncbi:hypothetical protein II906_05405 [bacterium]|nr:hypothetical protein [bacterium]
MKKSKILSLFLFIALLLGMCTFVCGCKFFHKETPETSIATAQKSGYAQYSDKLWCITFQMVWDEFRNTILEGKKVEFVDGNPPVADDLNKGIYSKDLVSEDSYYLVADEISPELKTKIEKAIEAKFHEKSDILHLINWNLKDAYLFYTMLIKNFNFPVAFDELKSEPFNNSNNNVKFFGIDKSSDKQLYKNVTVLFYNNNEYAVKLNTKEDEDVIIYRTDKQDSFTKLYDYVASNSKEDVFTKYDTLKIPNINVDVLISYSELIGKKIKYTPYIISQALQTIKFKLNNKGGKLKSEAAIVLNKAAMPMMEPPKERHFDFDKQFVLFLKENYKDKPYYAMRVSDLSYLEKD